MTEEAKGIEELAESIVETTKDYKNGDIMSVDHVVSWVEQFEEPNRLIILREMDFILKKYYVSRENAAEFLRGLLSKKEIVGDFASDFYSIEFLEIQNKGHSQSELLDLMGEVMDEHFEIDISDCGTEPKTYIYLDDCMFSGNTVLRDIEKWTEQNEIQNKTIHFVFLAMYNGNFKYINKKLKELFKGKNVQFKFWRMHEFTNNAWNKKQYQCLWPTQLVGDNENVTSFRDYIEEIRAENGNSRFDLFRVDSYPNEETLFTLKEARTVVEHEFLKNGCYLYTFRKNDSMKPMGYSYFLSTGFGAVFVTYRNIANNCPLVLWWGDPNQGHPLNQWSPLFPRSVN